MGDQANALRREQYQSRKWRPLTTHATPRVDGRPYRDPERLGRQVALHAQRGEWSQVAEVVQSAYRDANSREDDDRIAVAQLALPQRVINMLEAEGYVFADEVSQLSAMQLIAIKGMGVKTSVEVFTALRKVGLK